MSENSYQTVWCYVPKHSNLQYQIYSYIGVLHVLNWIVNLFQVNNNNISPAQSAKTSPVMYKQQVIVKPPSPKQMRNKSILCKPYMHTKGVSCRPHPCSKDTQTGEGPSLLSSYPSVNYILVICRSVFLMNCITHSMKHSSSWDANVTQLNSDLIRNFVGIFTEVLCCSPSTPFL